MFAIVEGGRSQGSSKYAANRKFARLPSYVVFPVLARFLSCGQLQPWCMILNPEHTSSTRLHPAVNNQKLFVEGILAKLPNE